MGHYTVSSCHSLKIIPVSRLTRFARINSNVVMLTLGPIDDAEAVPGTIQISTTSENGIIKKKISFERSGVSDRSADILESYKVVRLIATYVDESGNTRVAGSPDYPLSLNYTTGDGVFAVTLEGNDTKHDGFLRD